MNLGMVLLPYFGNTIVIQIMLEHLIYLKILFRLLISTICVYIRDNYLKRFNQEKKVEYGFVELLDIMETLAKLIIMNYRTWVFANGSLNTPVQSDFYCLPVSHFP